MEWLIQLDHRCYFHPHLEIFNGDGIFCFFKEVQCNIQQVNQPGQILLIEEGPLWKSWKRDCST